LIDTPKAEVFGGRSRRIVWRQSLFTGRIEGSLSAFPGFAVFGIHALRRRSFSGSHETPFFCGLPVENPP
jgi:hypothetical protein